MSHTVDPEDFTLAVIAIGAQPRLSLAEYHQIDQTVNNRMDLMTPTRLEYEAIFAALRVRWAIKTAETNGAVSSASPGDEVLVYRETTG